MSVLLKIIISQEKMEISNIAKCHTKSACCEILSSQIMNLKRVPVISCGGLFNWLVPKPNQL